MKSFLRNRKYHISLYAIIPAIFCGLSLLSVVIAHRVTAHYIALGTDPTAPLVYWTAVLALVTIVCGVLIARLILKPIERFVQEAEKLPAVRHHAEEEVPERRDQLTRIHSVFHQLTDILGKVEARQHFPTIVGQSAVMRGVLSHVLKVAESDATVLITGESGTGKEIIARNIFDHSPRREKPYVTINCAAIPESLLESELFGHERGAFTGADSRKIGKFEAAHRGTILLDEIGDMPLPLQGKILRVLEDKRIERLGGTTPVTVDVRFLAATNKNLERMVEEGSFRGDLYYRLKVMHLDLPPLRERKEDIPLLAEHLLERMGKRVRVTGAAMELLVSYDWPGNVRELQNVLERAVVLSGRRAIEPQHLALQGIAPLENEARAAQQLPLDKGLDHHLANIEKKAIIQALQHAGGVQVQAARLLGVKERSLWHRVKKHDIDVARFKPNKK